MSDSKSILSDIGKLKAICEERERQNIEKKELEENLRLYEKTIDRALSNIEICDGVIKRAEVEQSKVRAIKQQKIEESITVSLRAIMPEKNYVARIAWDSRGKVPLARVELAVPQDGVDPMYWDWRLPKNINGDFVKQMISLIILTTISRLAGTKIFIADEPANSGDDISLTNTKDIIEKLNDDFQLLFIEHKEAFFTHLNRREIKLKKVNEVSGNVNIGGKLVNGAFAGYIEVVSEKDVMTEEEV